MMRNVREKKRGRVKSEEDEKIEAKRKVRRDDISAVFENDPSFHYSSSSCLYNANRSYQ